MWRSIFCVVFFFIILHSETQPWAYGLSGDKVRVSQSHKLADGTTIDCIKIEDQPSLQHAHIRNHKIMKPVEIESGEKPSVLRKVGPQLFQREVGRCATGFIPILRRDMSDDSYKHVRKVFSTKHKDKLNVRIKVSDYEFYNATVSVAGQLVGASGFIQLSTPTIEFQDDTSATTISVIAKNCGPSIEDLKSPNETIEFHPNWFEAGIMFSPSTYRTKHSDVEDKGPHLYILTQGFVDDPTLSCLNHECGSFVQTSDKIVVGAEIVGEAGSFHFFQISKTGTQVNETNWWLFYEHEAIGYWPYESLYHGQDCLQDHASHTSWGGQLIASTPTTHTSMGSGLLGSKGFGQAAYIADIRSYLPSEPGSFERHIPKMNELLVANTLLPHFDVMLDFNNSYEKHDAIFTGLYYGGNLFETQEL